MKRKNTKQKGRRRIYVATLIVIVVALGFTSWYLYNINQINNDTSFTATSTDDPTVIQPTIIPPTVAAPKPTEQDFSPTKQTSYRGLPNCTYENGPVEGTNCPVHPPASYSEIPACYYSNPSFSGETSCHTYESISSIRGYFDTTSNTSYCTFFYGAGSMKSYKSVPVSNRHSSSGSAPDCSIENALAS